MNFNFSNSLGTRTRTSLPGNNTESSKVEISWAIRIHNNYLKEIEIWKLLMDHFFQINRCYRLRMCCIKGKSNLLANFGSRLLRIFRRSFRISRLGKPARLKVLMMMQTFLGSVLAIFCRTQQFLCVVASHWCSCLWLGTRNAHHRIVLINCVSYKLLLMIVMIVCASMQKWLCLVRFWCWKIVK